MLGTRRRLSDTGRVKVVVFILALVAGHVALLTAVGIYASAAAAAMFAFSSRGIASDCGNVMLIEALLGLAVIVAGLAVLTNRGLLVWGTILVVASVTGAIVIVGWQGASPFLLGWMVGLLAGALALVDGGLAGSASVAAGQSGTGDT